MSTPEPMKRVLALLVAFLTVFFAVGVPYWQIPYSQVSLPASLQNWSLAVVLIASAAPRWLPRTPFRPAWLAAGTAVPALVLARVAFETAIDPTSHNLWPFEVVIAAALGLVVAAAGAVLGGLSKTLLDKKPISGRDRGR